MAVIGFIGLGNMGMPMARNLVQAGYLVYGFNRSKEKEETFEELGGRRAESLSLIAEKADIIMTCLPEPQDVHDVLSELFEMEISDSLIIDFSTVTSALHENMKEKAAGKGVQYLDAPVSGGTAGAEAGTLAIMCGGEEDAFEKARPLFDVLGASITHTGPAGSGTKVKLINQYMVGMHTAAVAEALHLADESGIDKDMLYDVLSNSFAQSKIFDRHYPDFIAADREEPGFALSLLLKDLNLAGEMAGEREVPLEAGRKVKEMFEDAKQQGYGGKDMSAFYQYTTGKYS
ncbi:NAD(P)-dependent oxidoreductase [Salibacterium halotolerans]|uniref:3-hydroxyisobutyrate dehydrogenase n=1 Tax=Salibacterium halotolerans TaxID=1884432 RepID=A0A1I5T9A2_9BACI|nr:NAD(P)-dependent oxidoreductase [Salibacterium halotolerans]SFP79619.1 3-hydroxyisobutyrate dehydrogenase [Salibacterium halotolerans]